MNFWLSLLGYQAVWFLAVMGAAQGRSWPALLGVSSYAAWQLCISSRRATDVALMLLAALAGLLLDGSLIHFGLVRYAAPWPLTALPPAWILALWITFALTFTQSLRYLQKRLGLAVLLGCIGGPLAYGAAARGWHVVRFADPPWRALLWLAIGWAIATPLLARIAASATDSAPTPPVAASVAGPSA